MVNTYRINDANNVTLFDVINVHKAPTSPDYALGLDTESEPFEADMEDPSEEEPTKAEEPPPAQAAPTSTYYSCSTWVSDPFRRPYRTHTNGLRMMLTARKRGCAPFTLPPAIETTIIKEIAAPPGPSSPPLSPSPVLAVPPLDVLPPRKRVRSTSPHPDPTKEATTEAIAARLCKRVEAHH
ncbi:hypothetical protein Tco_1379320 [Tanacetum coccineum]